MQDTISHPQCNERNNHLHFSILVSVSLMREVLELLFGKWKEWVQREEEERLRRERSIV